MERNRVDALALLPVTTAAASAAFARAVDPARDPDECRQQLQCVDVQLAATARLLDDGRRELGRLAEDLARAGRDPACCGVPWPVCAHCPGLGLSVSAGVGHCRRCLTTTELPAGRFACSARASVTVRVGTQKAMCLSHAAGAVRQVEPLTIVAASRADRAMLDKVARESCIVRRYATRLAEPSARAGRD